MVTLPGEIAKVVSDTVYSVFAGGIAAIATPASRPECVQLANARLHSVATTPRATDSMTTMILTVS